MSLRSFARQTQSRVARLRSRVRLPFLIVAHVICAAAYIYPIWAFKYVPFLDLPQHSAVIHAIGHSGDPSFRYAEIFETGSLFSTYWPFYFGGAALSQFLSAIAVVKFWVSVSIVGLPAAMVFAAHRLRRTQLAAFAGYPLAYSFSLWLGFVSFTMALPLVVVLLTLTQELFASPAPRTKLSLAVVAVSLLLFFTHTLAFAVCGVAIAALFFVVPGQGLKRRILSGLIFVPSLTTLLLWKWLNPADLAGFQQTPLHARQVIAEDVVFEPIQAKLEQIPAHILGGIPAEKWQSALVYIGLFTLVVSLLWVVWDSFFANRASRLRDSADRTWLIVCVASLAVYLALPMSLWGVWAVSPRVASVILISAYLCMPARLSLAKWPLAAIFWISASYITEVTAAFEGFQDEVGEFDQLTASVPKGASIAGLITDSGSRFVAGAPFIHYASYITAERGGVTSFTFASVPAIPLRFKRRYDFPNSGIRDEWSPQRFDYDIYGFPYDYFLVRGWAPASVANDERLERVAQNDRWMLFRNRVPRAERNRIQDWPSREPFRAHVSVLEGESTIACDTWDETGWLCPQAPWMKIAVVHESIGGKETPCLWVHPPPQGDLFLEYPSVRTGAEIDGFLALTDRAAAFAEGAAVTAEFVIGTHRESVTVSHSLPTARVRMATPNVRSEERLRIRIHAENDALRHVCLDIRTMERSGALAP